MFKKESFRKERECKMNINVKEGSLPKRLLARELKENASLKDLVKKLQELVDTLLHKNESQAAHIKDVHKWYADNLKELDERTQENKLYLEEINRLKNKVCDLQDNYQKVIKLQKERTNK
jgi:predicted phosphohydrolase